MEVIENGSSTNDNGEEVVKEEVGHINLLVEIEEDKECTKMNPTTTITKKS